MQEIKIKTSYKSEVIDVTKEIKEAVIKSGIKNGIVTILSSFNCKCDTF